VTCASTFESASASVTDSPELAYEHNDRRISRAEFYAIACDPRRSVAVEACAGAGKTWMLVSRIVRALLDGAEPHEILAITFTRKAAGEMRARLHEWLSKFAALDAAALSAELEMRGIRIDGAGRRLGENGQDSSKNFNERGLNRNPDLRYQLSRLQQKVLQAGRPVQVRTFHSWFGALLKNAPLAVMRELGLPQPYILLEDDKEAVAAVWRPFHRAVIADVQLRTDFDALGARHGRSQTRKALGAALTRRTEFELADRAGRVEEAVPRCTTQFCSLGEVQEPCEALADPAVRARWLAWAAALGREKNKTPQSAAAAVIDAFALPPGAAVIAALRKAFFVATEDRLNKNLQKFEAALEAEIELQLLCAAQHQHEAWLHHHRMARLTRVLLVCFAEVKRANGWVDMNDVERAAHRLLSDDALAGWVQQRLDVRIKHLLIDEFQDTNPLQWQALHSWLSGYAGSGGGASGPDGSAAPGVFIVGDPKQSIYRFRRAEPQVFRAAQRFVVEGLGGDRLACDHTFRNAPEVVRAVNGALLAAQEQGEFDGYRVHTTESQAEGAVLCLPQIPRALAGEPQDAFATSASGDGGYGGGGDERAPELRSGPYGASQLGGNRDDADEDETDPEWRDSLTTPRTLVEESLRRRECLQAARWLAAEMPHRALQPGAVMVLSRRRAALSFMEDALRDLGIPTQQPEKGELHDAPEVQDIIALLDVLVSPGHDLSLARALRSPVFGCTDDDLVQIALALRALRLQRERGAETGVTKGIAHDAELASATDRSTPSDSVAPQGVAPPTWFDVLTQCVVSDADADADADDRENGSLPAHLRAIGVTLLRWRAWLQRLPPHDAIDAIYHDGDVLARFAAASPDALRATVLARLRAVPGAALALDGGRYVTPYRLVRALKAGGIKAPMRADTDAVRLLTVHGAKGLEADLVLLLDTEPSPSRSESMTALVDWPGESAAPTRFAFIEKESRPPPSAAAAMEAETTARKREEINTLYVAITRARRWLVLSSVEPGRTTQAGSWWERISPLATTVELGVGAAQACLPGSSNAASGVGGDGRKFFIRFIAPAIDEKAQLAIDNVVIQQTQPNGEAAVGLAMHRLLEWAPTLSAATSLAGSPAGSDQEKDDPQALLLAEGRLAAVRREFGLDAAQLERAAALASRIHGGQGAWAWDASQLSWDANEVHLNHEGRAYRLDRLVQRRDDGSWWVLDFKSAYQPQQQPLLMAQLRDYRAAVMAVWPGQTVHSALLGGDGSLILVGQ
jgi:ATP-dependent helicase/nuclease subunit A